MSITPKHLVTSRPEKECQLYKQLYTPILTRKMYRPDIADKEMS